MNSPEHLATNHGPMISLEPLALPIEETPAAVGLPRTRIFEAIRNNELTARKAGRSTIVEVSELKRWLQSLPTRGRNSEAHAA